MVLYLLEFWDADWHWVLLEWMLVDILAKQFVFADSDAVIQSLEFLLETLLDVSFFNPVENEEARDGEECEPDEELY